VRRGHAFKADDDASERGAKLRPASALAQAGVTPQKSKGQNFLVQPRVADRIVAAAQIEPGDDVIEIGPGLGILSDRLAQQPAHRLKLIELDARLAQQLSDRFADDDRIVVTNRDFLTFGARDFITQDLPDRLTAETIEFRNVNPVALRQPAPLRVVANLPFNVAAAILERLCGMHTMITRMVLMFQREVAERIRAQPGSRDYGALSAFTSMYWEIDDHFRVSAGSFHPKPRVDAEVLTFAPRRPLPFAPAEERAVLATVRAAFSAPRKTLRNAIGKTLGLESTRLESAFARAAIDPGARAATLAIEDLVRLARQLDIKQEHRDYQDNRDA
jgi:16S rRNA (adenine1518-N6/adenine1519-N6)-dimethyltransferase